MKAGFVGLIGYPNSGKSTFFNAVVGESLAIVSDKPQTTRTRMHGYWQIEEDQVVFVDAPGFVHPKTPLHKFLESEIKAVVRDADALLCFLPADETDAEKSRGLLQFCLDQKKKTAVIVSKMDLFKKDAPLGQTLAEELGLAWLATTKKTLSEPSSLSQLKELCLNLVGESPGPLFDPDNLTNSPMRDLAAEFIREQIFHSTNQEVPYQTAVRIRQFEEGDQITKIYADILVARDGQKGIVLGKGAQNLKKIGTEARKKLEAIMGSKVFLSLNVVVRENWEKNPMLMSELGYDVEDMG